MESVLKYIFPLLLSSTLACPRDADAQSLYKTETGFFATVDLEESLIRGHNRLDGPGLSGSLGVRFRGFDLGLYLRRAGVWKLTSQRWLSGSTTYGPIVGYTFRAEGHDRGIHLIGALYFVRDDHTVRITRFEGPTEYRGGPDVTAHGLRGAASYFLEISLADWLKIWPSLGVYVFRRRDYPAVQYFLRDGEEQEDRSPGRTERSVGFLFSLPVAVEPFEGHVIGLEPNFEVNPLGLIFFGEQGRHIALTYNF